jgi:hypothetical protein
MTPNQSVPPKPFGEGSSEKGFEGLEYRGFASVRHRFLHWWSRVVVRRLPLILWRGQEVEVRVTFREARLPEDATLGDAMTYLQSGRMSKIEAALSEIGITFDKGGGCEGRDWEWDWSLSGPISVRLVNYCTKPEARQ